MSKKIIAALLVFTLVFIGVFAACNKDEEQESEKLYLEGDEYLFFTDEAGNKVLDENGEFIVYQTDENGKYKLNENGDRMTVPQAFQAYSISNVVEDYGYKITLPENWKINELKLGAFVNEVTGDAVSIVVQDKSYQDVYESNFNTYESLLQYDEFKVTWEENVTDLGDNCEGVVRFTMGNDQGMNILYLFRNHGNIYKILYESKNPNTAVSDSIAICKAISYKPYDYFEPVTDERGNEVKDVFPTQPVSTTVSADVSTTAAAE